MYRFMPSTQPTSNPLRGLIGLGAVSSYYRTPIYSCAKDSAVVEYAKGRCASRSPNKEIRYIGYSTSKKGTAKEPYRVQISDVYDNLFDSCRVKLLKVCAPPPEPIVVDGGELTQLPIPKPYAAPVKPTTVTCPSCSKLVNGKCVPCLFGDSDQACKGCGDKPQITEVTPIPVVPTVPQAIPSPVILSQIQPVSLSLKKDIASEPKEILVAPPEQAIEQSLPDIERAENQQHVEPSKDTTSNMWVGGILLLVAGGGLATYFLTRKKRR